MFWCFVVVLVVASCCVLLLNLHILFWFCFVGCLLFCSLRLIWRFNSVAGYVFVGLDVVLRLVVLVVLISLLFLVWLVFVALGFGVPGYVVWFELRFVF